MVIGKPGRRISEADALDHVLGYTVANDVTMRDYQYKTHQWMQGKAWDALHAGRPVPGHAGRGGHHRAVHLHHRQRARRCRTRRIDLLIFPIPRLIATISEFTALRTGDLILTGTPSGVGAPAHPAAAS